MRDGLRRITFVLAMTLLIITMAPLSFADEGDNHDVEWWNFRNTADNNAVTNRPTPTNDQEAWGKWQVKVGTNYTNTTPTPPIIVDNKLYVAVGKYVQELNKETGEVLRTSEPMPAGAGYAMQSPVYADGKIFVAIAQGRICAVNIDDLSIAWVTDNTNILKGQTVSPISYVKIGDKGYVHTGTWVANGGAGDLICATTDDEDVEIDAKGNKIKNLVWSFNPNVVDKENLEANNSVALGYYWTGAYVTEKYLAIGSDNGSTMGDYVNDTAFYTLNPLTGEIIDAVYGIKGQVRSTAVYYNGCLYFTTKGAKVYKIPVDENGNLGEPSFIDLGEYDAVATTATVVVHNGKIYLGLQGKGGQFNSDGGHGFMVMRDDEVLSQSSFMYTIPVPGYPQAGALLSTYHEDEDFNGDGAADGRVYLFFTYNAPPGGIFYTYDTPDQTEPTALTVDEAKIFIPGSGKQQFCISSIVVDREGNLYYKNDSAHLFCVESNPAILSGIELFDDENTSIPLDQVFMPKIGEYSATLRADAEGAKIVLQLEEGVTATVAGQEYIEGGVVLPMEEDELSIEITTNKNGKGRTYSLVIHKAGVNADLASLGSAINNSVPSSTNKNTRTITPAFDKDDLDYTFDWITTGTGTSSGTFIDPATKTQMNIFLKPASEKATVKVWPGENIKEGNGGSSTLNSDGSIKAYPITNATYSLRFPLYSNDVTRDSTATIVVTAEDGVTEKTYNITFSRRVYVAEVLLKEKETMAEGETVKLEASINPPNATDHTLVWESSDESVAIVDEEGNVTAVGVGTATITATSSDGPSGETLVEVRHNWDEPTYVWSDDNSSVTATRVCSNNAEHIETETVESTSEITKPATETEDGVRTYTATFTNSAFEAQFRTETISMLGHNHDWGEPTYAWAEDNSSVTATRVCTENEDHVETETAESTSKVTKKATCTDKGETTYTANFINSAFATQTKTVDNIDALDHEWGEVTYTWSEDNRTVTAMRVCTKDASHIETETVDTTSEVTTPATETAEGVRTYTATFENTAFEAQTKIEPIPILNHEHEWGKPTYTWAEDNRSVTATRVCAKNTEHVETETVDTTSEVTKKATCTDKGETTYIATFTNTAFTTQTKTVKNIDALGHTPSKAVQEKVVEATCEKNGSYDEVVYCSVCKEELSRVLKTKTKLGHKYGEWKVKKKATCTAAGTEERVCANDKSHKETRQLKPLGHKYGPWKVTKKATCTATGTEERVCKNDKSHKETRTIKATGKHTWNAGRVTKQPTTTATGVKTFTCTVCKATRTETIAKLPIKDPALRRIHGSSRFKTSFAIAETYMKETKQTKLNSIIVASSTTFPDALAGSYLAKAKNAPIIIWHEQLNKDVQTFIKQKVKPGGTVYILGGTIAVGESIKKNMGGYKFVRLADTGRYGTNLRILDAVGLNKAEVLVCDGGNDGKGINALIASATGRPLLLVDKNGLIPIQKTWLSKNKGKITKFTIIGDGKSVSTKVENELKAYGNVARISGKNGDEVSAGVASTYYKTAKEIFIATMDDYPDGLCGGPLAIFLKGPILLVNAKTNAASVKYVKTLNDLTRANVLGGDKALPETLARKVAKNTKAKMTEFKK